MDIGDHFPFVTKYTLPPNVQNSFDARHNSNHLNSVLHEKIVKKLLGPHLISKLLSFMVRIRGVYKTVSPSDPVSDERSKLHTYYYIDISFNIFVKLAAGLIFGLYQTQKSEKN